MKVAIIMVLVVCAVIFFGWSTEFMDQLNDTAAWTSPAANISEWENGLIMIAVPFGILAMCGYLVLTIFKGKPPRDDTRRPPE